MPRKSNNKKQAKNQKDQKQKVENYNQKLQKQKQDQNVMDTNVNDQQETSQNQQQSDEQDSIKILSQYMQKMKNCPYRKQQAIKLFKTKGDKRAYSLKQIQYKIKQSLQQMLQHGFDFRYKWWFIKDPKKNKKRHFYKFSRKIYLRFECPKCRQKNGQKKRWTSILGNFQIRFRVQKLQKFWNQKPEFEEKDVDLTQIKYPKIVKWMLKIYKEYCESCNGDGIPFVFQSQVKACQIQFCRSIYGIMQKIKIPKNRGNRAKTVQVHHHKQSLCEACQKGVCFNIRKTQLVQQRDGEC